MKLVFHIISLVATGVSTGPIKRTAEDFEIARILASIRSDVQSTDSPAAEVQESNDLKKQKRVSFFEQTLESSREDEVRGLSLLAVLAEAPTVFPEPMREDTRDWTMHVSNLSHMLKGEMEALISRLPFWNDIDRNAFFNAYQFIVSGLLVNGFLAQKSGHKFVSENLQHESIDTMMVKVINMLKKFLVLPTPLVPTVKIRDGVSVLKFYGALTLILYRNNTTMPSAGLFVELQTHFESVLTRQQSSIKACMSESDIVEESTSLLVSRATHVADVILYRQGEAEYDAVIDGRLISAIRLIATSGALRLLTTSPEPLLHLRDQVICPSLTKILLYIRWHQTANLDEALFRGIAAFCMSSSNMFARVVAGIYETSRGRIQSLDDVRATAVGKIWEPGFDVEMSAGQVLYEVAKIFQGRTWINISNITGATVLGGDGRYSARFVLRRIIGLVSDYYSSTFISASRPSSNEENARKFIALGRILGIAISNGICLNWGLLDPDLIALLQLTTQSVVSVRNDLIEIADYIRNGIADVLGSDGVIEYVRQDELILVLRCGIPSADEIIQYLDFEKSVGTQSVAWFTEIIAESNQTELGWIMSMITGNNFNDISYMLGIKKIHIKRCTISPQNAFFWMNISTDSEGNFCLGHFRSKTDMRNELFLFRSIQTLWK